MTTKVLKQMRLKNAQPVVANFGFGKGNECLLLAQHYPQVIAVESQQDYIEAFERQITANNLKDRVQLVNAPLDKLFFEKGSFDLILSERGINYSDFDFRINSWKPFWKDGGYLALSELCVLKKVELPDELADFLCDSFPFREIETIDSKIAQIKDAGYRICGQHKLPDSCWINFYEDKFECYEDMPQRWKNSKESRQVEEYIENYKYYHCMYREYFGYVYFILRKPPMKIDTL
jgi:ubiquinone/menaquinone biosynthesis C-methylase UbiE